MSALLSQVLTPVPVVAPQGALWAGQAAVWLVRIAREFGRGAWRAMEAHGQRRAAHELLALAQRYQSHDPELAQTLRAASLTALTHINKEFS